MKRSHIIVAALALGLLASGCVFTSGQIRIFFHLDNFTTSTETQLSSQQINLNDKDEYKDHKGDLQDLSDLAVLGEITNTGPNGINVEIWMTSGQTSYTTVAQLEADATALKVWGPFALAIGEKKKVGWDESAALFTAAGKAALLSHAKGDGLFTVYAKAKEGTYSFKVDNGILVLVLDQGV